MIIIKLMGKGKIACILIVLVLLGYILFALYRPLPPIKPQLTITIPSGSNMNSINQPKLSWPGSYQAAVGLVGSDILLSQNLKPAPIASTAKMITSLVVLNKYPLKLGGQGPTITLTDKDVAIYNQYNNEQGSRVLVNSGEKITEYQMLEGMLLPSANNFADSLAIWAYGSIPNYQVAANNYLKSHEVTNTVIGSDASGFSPTTTSTASDLVKIGELLMKNEVLASIVMQKTVPDIPNDLQAKNVNLLLGSNNIIGIKTGNTDQAGGVYVSASIKQVADRKYTIVTAVVGLPTLFQSVNDSLPLIISAQRNVMTNVEYKKDEVIGKYILPWDKNSLDIKVSNNVIADYFLSNNSKPIINLQNLNYPYTVNQSGGSIRVIGSNLLTLPSSQLAISGALTKPSVYWRLTHL